MEKVHRIRHWPWRLQAGQAVNAAVGGGPQVTGLLAGIAPSDKMRGREWWARDTEGGRGPMVHPFQNRGSVVRGLVDRSGIAMAERVAPWECLCMNSMPVPTPDVPAL